MKMEGEIYNFTKVWLTVFISLTYCYAIGKITPKGSTRLLSILPIISLFLFLPLKLSSIHLTGMTAFFVSWLANFKLLLFAYDKPPLSSSSPSNQLSLPRFIATASFPIKIKEENPKKPGRKPYLNYAIKCILLCLLIHVNYEYKDNIHPRMVMFLYGFHILFFLELTLAIISFIIRTVLRDVELEPQFDEPYLSTSLQDFWGRRWNIMVTSILRPTVYEPILFYFSSRDAFINGRKWAPLPAVLSTFVVSAIMHEVIFYYLGRVRPTWEITWFFMFHGVCLVIEIVLKKVIKRRRFRLPTVLRVFLTFGFVYVTGVLWFFPQLLRCKADVRAFEEYAAVGAFMKDVGRALRLV